MMGSLAFNSLQMRNGSTTTAMTRNGQTEVDVIDSSNLKKFKLVSAYIKLPTKAANKIAPGKSIGDFSAGGVLGIDLEKTKIIKAMGTFIRKMTPQFTSPAKESSALPKVGPIMVATP